LSDPDIQTMMQKVINAFQPDKAAGVDAQVQLHLTGEPSGDWVATIRNQQLTVQPGVTPNPNLTFRADSQDVVRLFTGQINPMQAYMQGKVQMQGDMGLAMRMAGMFKKP
jgi:putative sterol carrier protein